MRQVCSSRGQHICAPLLFINCSLTEWSNNAFIIILIMLSLHSHIIQQKFIVNSITYLLIQQ